MVKNSFIIIFSFIVLSSGNLSALTVDVKFSDPLLDPLAVLVKNQVESKIGKFGYMPDFGRGFGNASTYASQVATLRGYQGYDIFAVAAGAMVSLQAPNEDPLFFTKLQKDLNDGDAYTGIGMNPLAVNGGINLSFLVDGLYMSAKYGKYNYKLNKTSYKIDYHSNVFGMSLNYLFFKEESILSRSILWRGISLESGFIYSNSITKLYKKLDPITGINTTIATFTVTAEVDPSINIELNTKSYIIPVELYTSIRIFYFLNIGVGGGFDYVAGGKTDITILSAGGATITGDTTPTQPFLGKTGTITVDASTNDVKANKYRTKVMANLGLSIGPVFVDIPVTYYFTDNGYAVGVSAGMTW